MRINVNKLWRGPNHFTYNDLAERAVARYLALKNQMIIESFTMGYDPTHDVMMSGKKIEIKIQSRKMLSIEYARPDHTPSGISLTQSEYYLMVNPGWNSKLQCETGKVRLINTNHLKAALYKALEAGNFKMYPSNGDGPGSRVVYLDPRDDLPTDGWIGDVEMLIENEDTIFNFDNPIEYTPKFSNKAITKIMNDIRRGPL